MSSLKKTGFTLVEVLLVIGVIAILASIVVIAINPTKQLAQSRDTVRRSHVNAIARSTEQYLIDHKGTLPASITDNWQSLCRDSVASSTCAANGLLYLPEIYDNQTYLAQMPTDPSSRDLYNTGYQIRKTAANRVQVQALWPETVAEINSVGYNLGLNCTCAGKCAGQMDSCSKTVCESDSVATPPSTITLIPGNAQMSVSWLEVPGATAYTLYDNSSNVLYTGTSTTYIDVGLNPTTYRYLVSATVCGVESAKSSQFSATIGTINFSVACTTDSPLGSACGGGWLICKAGDTNSNTMCSSSPGKNVVVMPTNVPGSPTSTQAAAINLCTNYTASGGETGWLLPRIALATTTTSSLNNTQGFNNEICQIMKRSNLCSNMTVAGGCSGGCLSIRKPITGINSGTNYWTINRYSSLYWFQNTNNGTQQTLGGAMPAYYVRCVRQF